MKKLFSCLAVLSCVFLLSASPSMSGGQATPQEIYEKVLEAANVLESLGEKGLPAFSDPKGEFVWKDTYVWVLDCGNWTNAAHPFMPQLVGKDLKNLSCKKTGNLFFQKFYEVSKNPNGGWVEYWWPKPGHPKDQLFRKITFVVQVSNRPYQVAAGIYNEDVTIEELNGTMK